jgi:geranylgeranyl diphosphate synthase type II
MHHYWELQELFEKYFDKRHFPQQPSTLYDPLSYFLGLGGKRIRPVLCLMGNELFDEIHPDAYPMAAAVELFHNFTLIHDDIMDKAPLRRGKPTLHTLHGEPTALLGGDVMLVMAYEYLDRIDGSHLKGILHLFNRTAMEVCEGQQLDMDFESMQQVGMDQYIHMIGLKTSVLLAASLRMGSIIGGASEGNQHHMYEFGRNLGIAFQIQDDYLDAFGDPEKFGKQVGGDIKSNKKTFLLIRALESSAPAELSELKACLASDTEDKVERVLEVYRKAGVDKWAGELKLQYLEKAARHLEEIAVVSGRKAMLVELMDFLVSRDK